MNTTALHARHPRQVLRWHPVPAADLQRETCDRILAAANAAIARTGRFRIVLVGGNTPRNAYRSLRDADTDWSRWEIFFGDERCLPASDPERNSRMAQDAWLDHVPIPHDCIHVIPAELGAIESARAYTQTLHGSGDFDLVLLGLGEDGHTASLFPGHDWGVDADSADALAVLDAPKPPPQRVSLSAARLGRAHEVLFLVSGESKRDAVARWRAGDELPARSVTPAGGVDILIDADLLPGGVA